MYKNTDPMKWLESTNKSGPLLKLIKLKQLRLPDRGDENKSFVPAVYLTIWKSGGIRTIKSVTDVVVDINRVSDHFIDIHIRGSSDSSIGCGYKRLSRHNATILILN